MNMDTYFIKDAIIVPTIKFHNLKIETANL